MLRIIASLCLVLITVLPLAAQSQSGRSAWFACIDQPDWFENPVKLMIGNKITELQLPRYMTSEAVRVPVDGVVRLVREKPNPDNPLEPLYGIIAEATIPEGVNQALILLMPLPEPEGDLEFISTVRNLSDFGGGDRMFINLSQTHMRVTIGDTTVNLPAKKARTYNAGSLQKATNMPVRYEFYHPEDEEWKLLTASTIVVRPTRRKILVFKDGTRVGSVKKHAILFPVSN